MLYFYGMPAQAQYGGGTGEPNDPYLIYTAEQMNAIGANTSDYHKHFKLMADIDLSGYTGTNFNIIGRLYGSFRGVFDGNGHTISNFIYNNTERDYIGLFGCVEKQNVEENVEIKNLGLIDPNVDAGTANNVGSLVGRLRRGTITNCYVEGGRVSGGARVGGLVGDNREGTITGSYASSTVTGDWPVGGLVGDNSNGNIITSYSTGTVRSTWQGPVGRWGASNRVGGLVGMGASGRVKSSFWDIETSNQRISAGGIGLTTAEMHDPNTFMDAGWDFVGAHDGPSDIWAEPAGGGYPILWWQLSPPPELPTFSGGTGEPEDPYLVSTAADLNIIGHNPRLMRAHFKLTNDIDLAGIDFYIIGSESFPYTGVFDGNGHTISNFIYINTERDYAIGLFGCVEKENVEENVEIKDLGLIDPNVDAGTANYVGSLVGWLRWGTITNCYVEGGSVSGEDNIGGMVGQNDYGTITNCYVEGGSVLGEQRIGGMVGQNDYVGRISECCASGSVTGYEYVGGIAGFNWGTISDCCASGSVRGYGHVGGLVGALRGLGRIIDSYATAGVSGDNNIGGLVGYIYWGTIANCCASGVVIGNTNVGGMAGGLGDLPGDGLPGGGLPSPFGPRAEISNCYSTGDVTGNRMVGGLVGWLRNGTIANCYSTGSVSGYVLIGGLLGVKASFIIWPDFSGITGDTISDFYSTANITGNSGVGQVVIRGVIREVVNSFWDVETSGRATSAGGTGKTTVEMQTASTFLAAGWDFVDETANGTEDIWQILEGVDYPRLWWQPEEDVVEQVSLPLRGESGEMILGLGTLEAAVYSPDAKYIATAGSLGVFLWDAETGALLRTLIGHTGAINSVAFSPDGTRVLTGSWDETAKLWDAETGQDIRTFRGHTGGVASVAFSPDGTRVLTGSSDKTAKLWGAETGQEIRTFLIERARV